MSLLNKFPASPNEGDIFNVNNINYKYTNGVWNVVSKVETNTRSVMTRLAAEAGFTLVDGSFEEGATLEASTDVVWWKASGKYYQWSGTFPKAVTAGSSPSPIEAGSWVDRTDDSLRDEIRETVFQNMKRLAAEAGFNLVDGSFEEGATLTNDKDVIWFQRYGKYYTWVGVFPKVVTAGTSPSDYGIIGIDWVDGLEDYLRAQLNENTGAELIGTSTGETVQEKIDSFESDKNYLLFDYDQSLTSVDQSSNVIPYDGGAYVNRVHDLRNILNFSRINTTFSRHHGLTSYAVENADNSFLVLTREALAHANDTTYGAIKQYKTTKGGRLGFTSTPTTVIDTSSVDDRDFSFGYMSSGRIGVLSSTAFSSAYPRFTYSDDNGSSWTSITVSSLPATFATWFGIHPYPAGGEDAFIAYGTDYSGDGGTSTAILQAITLDNGLTWTYSTAITDADLQPSEPTVTRIGNMNKWIMVYRSNSSSFLNAKISISDDMTTWTTPVESDFKLGKNPPFIIFYEGYIYLFACMRDSVFLGDLTYDAEYKNKLICSRTLYSKIVDSDYTDLVDFKVVGSFYSMNGYFTLTKSPLTGHLFGCVNYNEISDAYIDGLNERTSLALATTEKLINEYRGRQTSFVTNASGQWRVIRDNVSGDIELRVKNINVVYSAGNVLVTTVTLPLTLGLTTDITVQPILKGFTAGSSDIVLEDLGQVRIDQETASSFRISLFRTTGTGSFSSNSYATFDFVVKGTFQEQVNF